MADETGTIRPLPALEETRAPQVRPFTELRAHTAELRDDVHRFSQRASQLHVTVQAADLEQRAAQLSQGDPSDLLAVASDRLGMSWSLLSRLVGVSPTAIRKWRRGTAAMTPDNRRRLALVIAFAEVLGELNPRIVDPALWFETPILAATTLTPADLFAAGAVTPLLDFAAERIGGSTLLNEWHPGWREAYPADTRFDVVQAPDGLTSIVPTK